MKVSAVGRTSEVSLGDLEKDGYPETFHTGDKVEVAALHYNAAPRSGYPLRPAAPFADADTAGFGTSATNGSTRWTATPEPCVLILPDGRRPAYRADGAAIPDFVGAGEHRRGLAPILLDIDGRLRGGSSRMTRRRPNP